MKVNYEERMENIHPKYREGELWNMGVISDNRGYFYWNRLKLEDLLEDIERQDGFGSFNLLTIYPSINSEGQTIVEKAVEERKSGKEVELRGLLSRGE